MLTAGTKNSSPKKSNKKLLSNLLSLTSIGFALTSIIALNFLLFATNGGYNLFDSTGMFNLEFLYILLGILIFSFAVSILLSFSKKLLIIATAAIFGLMFFIFINQYSNISPASILSVFFPPNPYFDQYSNIIISAILGFLIIIFFFTAKKRTIFYTFSILIAANLGFIGYLYISKPKTKQIVEIYGKKELKQPEVNSQKLIYISFENLPSYNLLKDWNQDNADLTLGFFANNNFKLFPNSYVEKQTKEENLTQLLNFNNKADDNLFLDGVEINGYINFNKTKDENVFLKQNTLYNVFKKTGYEIVSYQTNAIDLCKVDNDYTSNKCFDVNINNVDIPNSQKLNTSDRATILLSQWANSTGIPFNIPVLDSHKYKEIYTISTLKQLNHVFNDIKNNNKQSLYFVDIKLPSSLYVFDKYCQVKPKNSWVSATDTYLNPQIKKAALMEQSQCLFAKLQELMDKTDNSNIVYILSSNTTAQAIDLTNKGFTDTFKKANLTTFAIKDPMFKDFSADYSICQNQKLLSKYLFKKDTCDIKDLNLQTLATKELEDDLLLPFENRVDSAKTSFNQFYTEYKKANNIE
ncbi:MAG: hypothetical protein R3Y43_02220 [Alphaproteobacteria bacterium]